MTHDHPEFYHHGSLSIHSLLGLLGLTRFLTACSTQTSQWKKRSTSDQHGLFGWWFADLKRFEVTYDRPLPISIIDVTSQTLVAKATSALACGQYIVHPTWITESVAAKRRLPERHFSLMARISQGRTRRTRRTGWWRTRETKTRVELVVVYVGSVIVFFCRFAFYLIELVSIKTTVALHNDSCKRTCSRTLRQVKELFVAGIRPPHNFQWDWYPERWLFNAI
jgi:hypothetical protein